MQIGQEVPDIVHLFVYFQDGGRRYPYMWGVVSEEPGESFVHFHSSPFLLSLPLPFPSLPSHPSLPLEVGTLKCS